MVNVRCPSCQRIHQAPDSVIGRKVKCNDCGGAFVAQTVAPDPPASTAILDRLGDRPASPPTDAAYTAQSKPAYVQLQAVPESALRAATRAIVGSAILVTFLAILQPFAPRLPGTETVLWETMTVAICLKIVFAVGIFALLIRMLFPLHFLSKYYIGLVCRRNARLSVHPEVHRPTASAGMSAVMLVYLGVLYWLVLPGVMSLVWLLFGDPETTRTISTIVRIVFLILALAFLVKLILDTRPIFAILTDSMTGSIVSLTESTQSTCPSCGQAVLADAKFCPSCGNKVLRDQPTGIDRESALRETTKVR
jgi:hypothetical protein